MNKFCYILLIGVFIGACTSNTIVKKPENLIPKDQMADLITDIILASSGEHIKNSYLERIVNYYPLVYEKYGIDSAQFSESNRYYTSRIDDYDEILATVEFRLKTLKKTYEDQRDYNDSINKMVRDSLRGRPYPKKDRTDEGVVY